MKEEDSSIPKQCLLIMWIRCCDLPHLTVEGIGVGNHLLQTRFHAIETGCARVEIVDWQHHRSCHYLMFQRVSLHVLLRLFG